MCERYAGRMINIHPSLLPKFPGAHAVRDTLASGEKFGGCTVHQVIEKVDAGAILAQERVRRMTGDTEETLHKRIKEVECRIYPKEIYKLLAAYAPT